MPTEQEAEEAKLKPYKDAYDDVVHAPENIAHGVQDGVHDVGEALRPSNIEQGVKNIGHGIAEGGRDVKEALKPENLKQDAQDAKDFAGRKLHEGVDDAKDLGHEGIETAESTGKGINSLAHGDFAGVKKNFGDALKHVDQMANNDLVKMAGSAAETVGDATSFVTEAAGNLAGIIADPLNALIEAGVGFLIDVVKPLDDILELVTGDPEALTAGAEGFSSLSEQIQSMIDESQQAFAEGLSSWEGDAADAAGKKLAAFRQGMEGTAGAARNISTLLQVSSMVMDVIKQIIISIISSLIEWLIITWVAALAASVVTLGGSDAAAAAATPIEVMANVAKGSKWVTKLLNLFKKISKFLDKIKTFLKEAKAFKALDKVTGGKVNKIADKVGETSGDLKKLAHNPANTLSRKALGEDGFKAVKGGEKSFSNALQDKANADLKDSLKDATGISNLRKDDKFVRNADGSIEQVEHAGWKNADDLKSDAKDWAKEKVGDLNPIKRKSVEREVTDDQGRVVVDSDGKAVTEEKADGKVDKWGTVKSVGGNIHDTVDYFSDGEDGDPSQFEQDKRDVSGRWDAATSPGSVDENLNF